MPNDQQTLLQKLRHLKVDRATGDAAPHKPILLLALFDMFELGEISSPLIPLSAELTYHFLTYWHIVAHRRKAPPDVRLPFHHLSGDDILEPLGRDQQPSADRKLTRFARLHDTTFAHFSDPEFRRLARLALVTSYFLPNEQIALSQTLGIPENEIGEFVSAVAAGEYESAVERGREIRFRMVVVSAYKFTCCLTRHRLTTVTRGSMVDAAHIHQFADSRNNDFRNGIALCKNAHWMFDQGLWTITDNYMIRVAQVHFAEDCPHGTALAGFDKKSILLPNDVNLHPDPVYLAWHRKEKFLGDD